MWNRRKQNTWKGLAAGLTAGLVASFTMDQFQAAINKRKRKEQGDDATAKVAGRISEGVFRHQLTNNQKRWAAPAVHYIYGALVGGLYGALAERRTPVRALAGVPYGAAVWLLGDEVAMPLLQLSKGPRKYPIANHARALASHVVYGATTDLVRRVVRRAL